MNRFLIPSLLTLLAACGTPQEQCIAAGTRDLRVVDQLIQQTQANLARGYALVEVTEFHPDYVDCTPRPTEAVPDPAFQQCLQQVPITRKRPMAIDLNAESAKLQSLQAKRSQQLKAAGQTVAECKVLHPE